MQRAEAEDRFSLLLLLLRLRDSLNFNTLQITPQKCLNMTQLPTLLGLQVLVSGSPSFSKNR